MVSHRYTEEERAFLREFVPGHSRKEIVEEYNKRFQEPITISRLKGCLQRYKLNTGRTGKFEKGHIPVNKGKPLPRTGRMSDGQFKKGNLPRSTKPVGYERITKDGYVEVKVRMRPSRPDKNDNFVAKQRLVWEEHYGAIPPGHRVIFLDGDKMNFSIENLALVSCAEKLQLTRMGAHELDTECMKSAVLLARSVVATARAKKRKGNK